MLDAVSPEMRPIDRLSQAFPSKDGFLNLSEPTDKRLVVGEASRRKWWEDAHSYGTTIFYEESAPTAVAAQLFDNFDDPPLGPLLYLMPAQAKQPPDAAHNVRRVRAVFLDWRFAEQGFMDGIRILKEETPHLAADETAGEFAQRSFEVFSAELQGKRGKRVPLATVYAEWLKDKLKTVERDPRFVQEGETGIAPDAVRARIAGSILAFLANRHEAEIEPFLKALSEQDPLRQIFQQFVPTGATFKTKQA